MANKITTVIKEYREVHGLSLRKFADAINEKLINTNVTYGTVNRWEDEKIPYEPDMRLLFECIATYDDWRRAMAIDCFYAMFPDLVQRGIVSFKI